MRCAKVADRPLAEGLFRGLDWVTAVVRLRAREPWAKFRGIDLWQSSLAGQFWS
jgi:hypothetical protein